MVFYTYTVDIKNQEENRTFQTKNIPEIAAELKTTEFTVQRILQKNENCKMCKWVTITREKVAPKRIRKKKEKEVKLC